MRGGFDLDGHERDPTYSRSARRHCEAKRQEILWEHLRYHRRMIEAHTHTLERLIERHRAVVEACEEMLGRKGNDDERKKSA